RCRPYHVPDPSRVGTLELLADAKSIAHDVDDTAELCGINLYIRDGAVDLSSKNGTAAFFFRRAPPADPSGLAVVGANGLFTVFTMIAPSESLPDPQCTEGGIWSAVLDAGLPKDAAVSVTYARMSWSAGAMFLVRFEHSGGLILADNILL